MNKNRVLSASYILFIILALALPFVLADGATDSLSTTVTVQNAAPSVGAITCDPSPVTLSAETTTFFNCTATVTDTNGYEDLRAIRGEFYNDSLGAAANYTKHYNNATCTYISNNTAATDSLVECTFALYYHANPYGWTIYFNVSDAAGSSGINTAAITVNPLTALNVTNTTIPFGTVNLDAESAEITTTIKNTGNVKLDVRLNETANSGNLACDGPASADIDTDAATTGVRYNTTSGFTFDEATWKLNQTSMTRDVNWAKSSIGSGTATPPEYNLYWLIKLPSSGISGTCSGTTQFTVSAS